MSDGDDGDPPDDEVAMACLLIFALGIAFVVFIFRPVSAWPTPHPIRAYIFSGHPR